MRLTANPVTRHDPGPYIYVSSHVLDLDERIKNGDSGWRGDPSMDLMFNPETRRFEVWGTDAGGNRYLACSHHKADNTLIEKLILGDPTKFDVVAGVLETNARIAAQREAAEREKRLAAHDKLAWAIRQDFGHLAGGRRTQHSMYDATKHKGA